jgi:hypothetical protein
MDQRTLQSYRLAIGLVQGLILYGLHYAYTHKTWPATDPAAFAPLLTVAIFVPLKAISGLGNMRLRTLALWLAGATILCGAIAFYDVFREPILFGVYTEQTHILPSFNVALALAAILFISHTLIVAGETDRKWIADYSTYFDISWKHGVQAVLGLVFVGVLWAILYLGASLFALINITFIRILIMKPLFWIPVTAVSLGYAIHLTDVRATIVRGTRTLILLLLAWLLPVMAVFAIGFVLTLPFTGLDVLWTTRRATEILLASSAVLIFLINAAYQDGNESSALILRYCRALASIVLVPLVALAAYALALRVAQHGWSPQRIVATACVVIAACYASGYAYAALRSGLPLTRLEIVNILTAYAVIAVLFVLHTPFMDPARLSVADQIARLNNGQTAPEKFDYAFLRFRSGRFGTEALDILAHRTDGPNALDIAERAKAAIDTKTIYAIPQPARQPPPVTIRTANITVFYPKDAALPQSFLAQDWTTYKQQWMLPRCMTADAKCDAALIDLDGDGTDELLLFTSPVGQAAAFALQPDKIWTHLGSLSNSNCPAFRDALRQGAIAVVSPPYKDIEAGGQRMRILVNFSCPPKVAAPK